MTAIHGRITHLMLALVLLALLAIIGMLATGVRGGPLDPSGPPASTSSVRLPGTPIEPPSSPVGYPIVISQPGHYYLTGNLNPPEDTRGLTISASDVSLDLGGFTITGSGNGVANAQGILLFGAPHRVHISNGVVQGFAGANGVAGAGAQFVTIENVTSNGSQAGFVLGSNSVLRNCVAANNADSGILISGSYSRIENCVITSNAFVGVSLQNGDGHVIERSTIANNNTVLVSTGGVLFNSVDGSTIRDNDFWSNGGRDAVLNSGSGNNVFLNNTLDCPGDITDEGGNNFIPVNTTDPGTNRAHRSVCPV